MVVAENTSSTRLQIILTSFARDTLGSGEQARGIFEALETENTIRTECLELGVIGRLTVQSDVISLSIDETERTPEFQNTIEELAEDTKGTSDVSFFL
ncbi:hypothetical protein CTI12_AA196580 [Artemisia annua]|uniref:Uncharacterized protein n=1 Tax=Artemisia annua TaxID=35608 RepID=A0A2U1NFD3_ARTAN|nr:hypothetical protein CTI12_AA625630 [Artemisia annua]PWA72232.1 hypothetical protein CTI12_AA196580 [Artemisia annua]